MKYSRNIFLIIFLVIFLVSNTGLPFSIHLCQMMKKASLEKCDMCRSLKDVCCDDNTLKISKTGLNGCCDTRIAAEPLKDRYISSKDNPDNQSAKVVAVLVCLESNTNSPQIRNSFFTSDSPPGNIGQEIYLLNSTLLI